MTTATDTDTRVVLWQLQISHYNEKVRWALDYKRIPHTRRSTLPGLHRLIAKRLAGIVTTPVLTVDGESIGDSTAILAALEERFPEPPLMPENPLQRRRALRLEEFFDEELGPHIRRALYWELLTRPDLVRPLFTNGQTAAGKAIIHGSFPVLKIAMRRIMDINEEPCARSREKVVEALDVLEKELGDRDYLVGDSFSIADLTAASLFYPLAGPPPEYPYPTIAAEDVSESARAFMDSMTDRPGAHWVAEMYRRHRLPS
jgi:glutathione S-transferase